ncbi:MAG TPA: thioredoxin family protein [Bdellovibrionota bacterium]|jgi:thiol:disulfide interchange protein DsbD|nr:thioredoxin family protein [Bdellovibrionota bacterium]
MKIANLLGAYVFLMASFSLAAEATTESTPAYRVENLKSPHAEVKLVASHSHLVEGEPFQIGFLFNIEPEWHIYWRNPGDSGTPLSVKWSIPSSLNTLPQRWPLPKRLPVGPLANYGYEGQVLLPFDLEWKRASAWATEDRGASRVKITARADWLICRVECLPAEGTFEIEIPIERGDGVSSGELSSDKHLFDKVPYADKDTIKDAVVVDRGSEYEVEFTAPEGFDAPAILWDFYSGDELRIQHAPIPTFELSDRRVKLHLVKDTNAPAEIATLSGLVMAQGKEASDRVGFEIVANAATTVVGAPDQPLALLIFFALLGGILLNVMPCVFPVLSLKILGFVHEAGEGAQGRSRLRRHGWVFALGVLVSFWLLAGLLIVLRGSGVALGWGFQLQSPLFVSALAVLFLLIGLNFIGFFELNFSGGRLATAGATRGGYVSSFLSGVLATVVATPCTAPFMGVALGAALALPPLSSILIFTGLGFGMALPYVLLSHFPQWLRFLPRPGAWMETFRQLLAFPIFATALWLLWVILKQNPDLVIDVLMMGLLVSFVVWLTRAVMARTTKAILGLLALAGGLWLGNSMRLISEAGSEIKAESNSFWQPFTPEAFDEALATSEYVFVDFTASWCITCQVNKKVVLNTDAAKEFFAERGVTAMRADWTHQDPQISKVLESLGRSSVPTYAIFRRDRKTYAVLPEILSLSLLSDEVQKFMGQSASNNSEGETK